MNAFNESLSYDKRMYAQDIKGSIAYSKALCLRGIITKEEQDKIIRGLDVVGEEWTSGQVSNLNFQTKC